ncbi:MAG: hypothetical protein JNL28_00825 [Planctomycetes bacterium]|nr:hypothetical protein [Planctomycetota bacterium]
MINRKLTLPALAALLCCATASASNFSVSGVAGNIPAGAPGATGGGGTWATVLPTGPGTSTVVLANPVTSITSIEIAGLTHTWIGDVHVVLRDPTGVGHNIFVRPAYLNTSTFGNSGDFQGGTYTFVAPGTPGALMLPTSSATVVNPAPGIYEQAFGTLTATWVSGNLGIDNASLDTITGPAGTWTLEFYDWAGGDYGSFSGWTMNGVDNASTGTPFCLGDGTAAACPCGNNGASGRGCASSAFPAGAILSATGNAGASIPTDTLVLTATDIPGPGLFFQANGLAAVPINFGDGQLCASAGILRLGVVFPTAGVASYPGGLTPAPIHVGGLATNGATKHYQCWYRSVPGLCSANNYDLTQGLTLVWGP